MWVNPDKLSIAAYRFVLSPLEPMELPAYKGALLRGGFGATFKQMVCPEGDPQSCTPCRRRNDCPYGYVFETSPPEGSQVLRNLSDVPTPFVIEPPLDQRTHYRPGDELEFQLVLVGQGINYLPYFFVVFEELGRAGLGRDRSRYRVELVEMVDPLAGATATLYTASGGLLVVGDTSLTYAHLAERAARLPPQRITLRFQTPTRIKHQDRFVSRPDFHVLVRALLRRVSSLLYFHCGELWQPDFGQLIASAAGVEMASAEVEWADWERYSTRQRQHMNLGGFVGEVTYAGDLGPFRPLLAIGELVHVGKGAVFGLGRYRLEPLVP